MNYELKFEHTWSERQCFTVERGSKLGVDIQRKRWVDFIPFSNVFYDAPMPVNLDFTVSGYEKMLVNCEGDEKGCREVQE